MEGHFGESNEVAFYLPKTLKAMIVALIAICSFDNYLS
jgi:hypothetical protein